MDGSMQDVSGGGDLMPLSPAGVDFANETQAFDFLADMLDDSVLQVIGNAYATYFWYGTACVVGIAALVNVYQSACQKDRIRRAALGQAAPATPRNPFTKGLAGAMAIAREVSYPQMTPAHFRLWFKLPPLGTILLLVAYLAFVLVLEFSNNDIPGAQHCRRLATA